MYTPALLKCIVQSPFVESKYNRSVLPCISASHTRATSGGYGEQPVRIIFFCWYGSLKPHCCGPQSLEGLKSLQPSSVPQNALEGICEKPSSQTFYWVHGFCSNTQKYVAQKHATVLPHFHFQFPSWAQNEEQLKQNMQHLQFPTPL